MKIEIWSDIVCPFCYIGKRKFENALSQFKDKDQIEIEWKSFQLSPDKKTEPEKSVYQYLAEHKGISLEIAKSMSAQVTNSARQVGLEYDFDKAIPPIRLTHIVFCIWQNTMICRTRQKKFCSRLISSRVRI
jgi:predicted DsbA family dithiol-disulfide isomerase